MGVHRFDIVYLNVYKEYYIDHPIAINIRFRSTVFFLKPECYHLIMIAIPTSLLTIPPCNYNMANIKFFV